jgi:SAM-dependent methyltransferase
MTRPRLQLRRGDGSLTALDADRWHGEPSAGEMALLRQIRGPVLDVGCGPGRLVVGLGRLGVMALGIDPAPGAVRACRRRGAPVLQRSVFDRIPAVGRWRTVLLADGNIGIGGDPVHLLARCRALAEPDGRAIVELAEPGTGLRRHRARLEWGTTVGPWFAWAEVGTDAIAAVAGAAGWTVDTCQEVAGESRWFAGLRPNEGALDAVA